MMLQKSVMVSQLNSELTDTPGNSSKLMNLHLSQQMRPAPGPFNSAGPQLVLLP